MFCSCLRLIWAFLAYVDIRLHRLHGTVAYVATLCPAVPQNLHWWTAFLTTSFLSWAEDGSRRVRSVCATLISLSLYLLAWCQESRSICSYEWPFSPLHFVPGAEDGSRFVCWVATYATSISLSLCFGSRVRLGWCQFCGEHNGNIWKGEQNGMDRDLIFLRIAWWRTCWGMIWLIT